MSYPSVVIFSVCCQYKNNTLLLEEGQPDPIISIVEVEEINKRAMSALYSTA